MMTKKAQWLLLCYKKAHLLNKFFEIFEPTVLTQAVVGKKIKIHG